MRDDIATRFQDASVPPMSIDPGAVISGGRARRRRRNLAALAGTAAGVLVLGVGGWAVLSDSTPDDRTLPAATPSLSSTVSDLLVDGPATEIELGVVPPTGRTTPVAALFRFDPAESRVGFTLQAEDGTVLADHMVGESRTGRPIWSTMVPGLTLAVLPAGATAAIPIWGGSTIAAGTATAEAPDGRVLVAWWAESPEPGPFMGLTWAQGDTVLRADGYPMESTRVGDVVFHFAQNRGGLGYIAPPTQGQPLGWGQTRFADELEPGTFLAVWAPGPTDGKGLYAVLLPPARDVEIVTTDEGTVQALDTTELDGNAGTLVVARVEGPATSVTGVRFTSPELGRTGGPAPAE